MSKGKVKFFNDSKGYGFITDEKTGKEVFVHVSDLVDKIRTNDNVTFESKQGKKGEMATNVQLA